MRILHWYIKNALAWMYASQSSKITAFLPYIAVDKERTLKDVIPQELSRFRALEDRSEKREVPREVEARVIDEEDP